MAEDDFEPIDESIPPKAAPPKSNARIVLGWIFKLGLLVAIFWYLFGSGRLKLSDLGELARRWDLMLWAMTLIIPAVVVCSLRYQLLLRALNVHAKLTDIFSLSMIGMLFDLVSPVSNGGDVVKAVYLSRATRAPGAPSNFGLILFSVLLDRIVGLFALFTFALIVCAAAWPQISSHAELRRTAVIVVLVCIGGLLAFFVLVSEKLENSTLRKRLMHILPFHEKFEAIYAGFANLRHHKRVLFSLLGLSIFNHAFNCGSILVLVQGMSFKSTIAHLPASIDWVACLTILPLGLFFNTFGPAGGLGGGNAAFEYLFTIVLHLTGGADVALRYQICGILFRLAGIPFLIFYRHKGANLTATPDVA